MRILVAILCFMVMVAQPVLAQEPPSTLRIRIELVASEPDLDWDIAQQVIEQRLNGLGLVDSAVERGDNRLIITTEAPLDFNEALGLSQRLIDMLEPIALLEFVDLSSVTSSNVELLEGACVQTVGQHERGIYLDDCLVQSDGQPFPTVLTGDDLAAARANDLDGRWQLDFELSDDASDLFGDFTQSHIGSALAIVLDGQVLSAPIINARIDGYGVIAGNFTEEEINILAIQLQSGSLPIGLEVQSVLIHRGQ